MALAVVRHVARRIPITNMAFGPSRWKIFDGWLRFWAKKRGNCKHWERFDKAKEILDYESTF
jgi:hypothetical protein